MRRFLPRGFPRFPPQQAEPDEEQAAKSEPEVFYPSVRDVTEVRGILRLGLVPEGLPTEIVDLIIDTADYWPSVETKLPGPITVPKDGDRELVRTPPLCLETPDDSTSSKTLPHRGQHPCRKIIFDIWSRDQGFGGGSRNQNSKYDGSYSWFDAFIVPADHKDAESSDEQPFEARIKPGEPYFIPTPNRLQSNVVANGKVVHHHIVWHHEDSIKADSHEAWEIELAEGRGRATLDGSAVREMKIGDSVSVWARARFAGWSNHVERLIVRVFWSL